MSDVLERLREKYPAYADTPDDELTKAIGTKYPQYLDDEGFKGDFEKVSKPASKPDLSGLKMPFQPGITASSFNQPGQAPEPDFGPTTETLAQVQPPRTIELPSETEAELSRQRFKTEHPDIAEKTDEELLSEKIQKASLTTEEMQALGVPKSIAGTVAPIERGLAKVAGTVGAPENAALIAGTVLMPQTAPVAARYFGAQMALTGAPETYKGIKQAIQAKTPEHKEQALETITEGAGTLATLAAPTIIRNAKLLPRAAAEALRTLEGEDASGIGAVARKAQKSRVEQETSQEVKSDTPTVSMSPEEQAHVESAKGSVPYGVEVGEQHLGGEEPFSAGTVATINRKTGKIVIIPGEFKAWLKDIPENQRASAVRAMMGEEANHLATSPEDAQAYWGLLTDAEKAAAIRTYTGKRTLAEAEQAFGRKFTDQDLGFEAVNHRMKQLGRMSLRETAEAVGREKWTLRAITTLQRVVSRIMESLPTKASAERRGILQKVKANLEAAAQAAGGTAPAALNKFADKLRDEKQKPNNRDTIEVGLGVRSTADLDQLAKLSDEIRGESSDLLKRIKAGETHLAERGMTISTRAQLPREAIEAATNTGSWEEGPETKLGPRPLDWRSNPEVADWLSKNAERLKIKLPDDFKAPEPAALRKQSGERDNDARTKIETLTAQAEDARKSGNKALAASLQQSAEEVKRAFPNWQEQAFPATLRKKRPELGQETFNLPPMRGGQAAERQIPAGTYEPVTATKVEQEAARHLTETARPSFTEFAKDLRTKFGDVKPGQLRETWGKAVWDRLTTATGDELASLRTQMGLGREFGDRAIADAPPEAPKGFQLEAEPVGAIRGESKTLDAEAQKRARAEQNYRNNLIARMGERLIGEAESGKKAWSRSEVTPEDLAAGSGAWQDIGSQDLADPQALGRVLTEGAGVPRSTLKRKVSGGNLVEVRMKAPPESVTRALVAMVNKVTGKVDLVSAYRTGDGVVRLVDPGMAGKARPNVPVESILERYRPIAKMLLDEPVQNFHQRFNSLREFEDSFGQEARQSAEREASQEPPGVEGEFTTGPTTGRYAKSGIFAEGRGETAEQIAQIRSVRRLAPNEAGAVLDHVYDEVSNLDSPQDMRDALDALTATAEEGTLSERDWNVIAALDKASEATAKQFPELTANQAIDRTLNDFYDIAKAAKDRNDFIQKSLERFSPEAPKAFRPEPEPPGQGAASQGQPAEPVTLAAFSRKGAPVAPTKAAPSIPEGTLVQATSRSPATINKKVAKAIKEGTEDVIGALARNADAIASMVTRSDLNKILPARLDGADNVARNVAATAERKVTLPSAEGTWGKFHRGKKQILESANALVNSGFIAADYPMDAAASARFQEILDNNGIYQTILKQKDPRTGKPMRPTQKQRALVAKIEAEAKTNLISEGLVDPSKATYSFDDDAKLNLDDFEASVRTGKARAEAGIKRPRTPGEGLIEYRREKYAQQRRLREANRLIEEVRWARDHWDDPELRQTALVARQQIDQGYAREKDNGSSVRYLPDYLPGRYQGEFFNDGAIRFPGVLGTNFKAPKTFPTAYDAIEAGPYISLTRDISQIVGHRIGQGERKIQHKGWINGIKRMTDEVSGEPVLVTPKIGPDGKPLAPSTDYYIANYEGAPYAVRNGYQSLFNALTGDDKFTEFTPARIALEWEQKIKHTLLAGDFFHLGRLSAYMASIMGKKAGYHGGINLLEFNEATLGEAVKRGVVSKESADWALGKVAVNFRPGRPATMLPRMQLAKMFLHEGLNAGQIQDALYKDLIRDTPFVGELLHKTAGRYNRWLFDTFTRGALMESAVREFERLSAKNPNIKARDLMRDVSTDLNRYFGNIGRQGFFKSKSWQSAARLAFLAPQWIEGLVMKELGLYKRTVGAGLRAVGLPGGRQGLPEFGTLGRGMARGLFGMLVLTQALNLISRRKPTWQNEDNEALGQKFDAWLPAFDPNVSGFRFSPLSMYNEITHDIIRLVESKDTFADAIVQIGNNKLSPFGRAALAGWSGIEPGTGQKSTTSLGRVGMAAKQIVPAPITFTRAAQEGLSRAGIGHPPPPGSVQRQLTATAGFKVEPIAGSASQIQAKAKQFMIREGWQKTTGWQQIQTDEPSYTKLRSALKSNDTKQAERVWQALKKTHDEQKIGQAMKLWAKHPFTGSASTESKFLRSLTPEDRELYDKANVERQEVYQKFKDFVLKH
jgi:hypothetical protein